MDWVGIAIRETFESIAQQQKLNAEMEAERLSGLQDQHEDTGLCTCGVMIADCDDAYEHITRGV
tara:strand:- start:285 stop:476 length:192 start_codon:yes stop_codon:yes gene_type:complete